MSPALSYSAVASPAIAWLRRDLRTEDHRVFYEAQQLGRPVLPVFVLDTQVLARFTNQQDMRLSFLATRIAHMHQKLQQWGSGMLVVHGKAAEVIPRVCAALRASHLVAGRDLEPACILRDQAVEQALRNTPCSMQLVLDHLIRAPEDVLKDDGAPYVVYTPFSKRWLASYTQADSAEYTVKHTEFGDVATAAALLREAGLSVLDAANPQAMLAVAGYELVDLPIWHGADDAQAALKHFTAHHVYHYKEKRDLPAEDKTSKLSPYLRFGCVSVRACLRAVEGGKGAATWVNELIWREFYAHILYHFPHVVTQEFQAHYHGTLHWRDDAEALERWKQGKTGYPFVDAAMRQLLQDGWMHNRARMVVASFLCKDLQIDWRKGEEHFAQHLMDYDLASNNGGWQWSASVGTDAQPWFRIFNPILQSKKFDPDGEYIRRYVPELAHMPTAHMHEPWKYYPPASYPQRMVDHYTAREDTLAMFKAARGDEPGDPYQKQ